MKRIVTAAAAVLMLSLSTVPVHAKQTSKTTDACTFPTTPPAAGSSSEDFATCGWNMFIALNWTPKSGERGEPDCSQSLGSSTAGTVWQTYKTVPEIFLANAEDPGPWNSQVTTPVFKQIAKASPAAMDAAEDGTLNGVLQPVGGWLIDQQGNPTYYEMAVDETSYDYIVQNQFYNADIVNKANNIVFPDGSLETKASWRILTPNDDPNRYLTKAATVELYNADGTASGNTEDVTLGLVGFHIIFKAEGYPQWIWATFEQVDNVAATNGSYSNPDAPADEVNQSPCKVGVLPCTPKDGRTFQTPDPLTRVTPIQAAADDVNTIMHGTYADTFAKYYELVGTQVPADPSDPGNPLGTPTPNILANTTMESYLQPTSSCMACHSTAVSGSNRYKSDFSFVFLHAQTPESGN